uniref:Helix-turn-helix domain-containing protein n=1 Tax=Streptomyces sp. NBC_00003 TaxID=2903608 RepID=A0AAU2VB34_9ACTN
MTNKLMDADEVAAYLGKKKNWVYGEWKRQGLPFVKIGQQLRCRPEKLNEWIDSQEAA